MSDRPIAYHITFGTYGTRLHGDDRGTVDRRANKPDDPIVGQNEDWQHLEASDLRFPPVIFMPPQRRLAEAALAPICERGGWTLHLGAAQPDHVHVLLTSDRGGKAVRRWLKVWLGQALSQTWPLAEGATWWAEGGSVKWIWDEAYFGNVLGYIAKQRST